VPDAGAIDTVRCTAPRSVCRSRARAVPRSSRSKFRRCRRARRTIPSESQRAWRVLAVIAGRRHTGFPGLRRGCPRSARSAAGTRPRQRRGRRWRDCRLFRRPRLDARATLLGRHPDRIATTTLMPRFLHCDLGPDIVELYRDVRPTWKLGIQFDWTAPRRLLFQLPRPPRSARGHAHDRTSRTSRSAV